MIDVALLYAALLGYLFGSIPFGLLLTRLAGFGDVRRIGSGNIGATNVLRTGSRALAALTLLFDAVKGLVPVIIAARLWNGEAAIAAGFGALAGHILPLWLGFKGGKGVATNIGILFGLYWPLGLIFLAVWLAMAFLFRFSSLSALTASALSPLGAGLVGKTNLILPLLLLALLIWFMHRANIARLLKGEEAKIKLGSDA